MEKKELTIEEMDLLIGGVIHASVQLADDVVNLNTIDGCGCSYNNFSTISNTNQILGCRCRCTKPQ